MKMQNDYDPSFVRGECLDRCGAEVVSGITGGEYAVIHAGVMCDGFRLRFTPSKDEPCKTLGMDEALNTTHPVVSRRKNLGDGGDKP